MAGQKGLPVPICSPSRVQSMRSSSGQAPFGLESIVGGALSEHKERNMWLSEGLDSDSLDMSLGATPFEESLDLVSNLAIAVPRKLGRVGSGALGATSAGGMRGLLEAVGEAPGGGREDPQPTFFEIAAREDEHAFEVSSGKFSLDEISLATLQGLPVFDPESLTGISSDDELTAPSRDLDDSVVPFKTQMGLPVVQQEGPDRSSTPGIHRESASSDWIQKSSDPSLHAGSPTKDMVIPLLVQPALSRLESDQSSQGPRMASVAGSASEGPARHVPLSIETEAAEAPLPASREEGLGAGPSAGPGSATPAPFDEKEEAPPAEETAPEIVSAEIGSSAGRRSDYFTRFTTLVAGMSMLLFSFVGGGLQGPLVSRVFTAFAATAGVAIVIAGAAKLSSLWRSVVVGTVGLGLLLGLVLTDPAALSLLPSIADRIMVAAALVLPLGLFWRSRSPGGVMPRVTVLLGICLLGVAYLCFPSFLSTALGRLGSASVALGLLALTPLALVLPSLLALRPRGFAATTSLLTFVYCLLMGLFPLAFHFSAEGQDKLQLVGFGAVVMACALCISFGWGEFLGWATRPGESGPGGAPGAVKT